ncbi:MAG: tetratricopeptide repeat protein [Smithella sp.]
MKTKIVAVVFPLIIVIYCVIYCGLALAAAVPEEAQRYMVRGLAALEMAKKNSDYSSAIKEFMKAAELAPNWPDVYFNLGNALNQMGDMDGAVKNFRRYLELAPNSPDAGKVREEMIKIEYRAERIKDLANLQGNWVAAPQGQTYLMNVHGQEFMAIGTSDVSSADVNVFWNGMVGPLGFPPEGKVTIIFKGKINGTEIVGVRDRQPISEKKSGCTIPPEESEVVGSIQDDKIILKYHKTIYQADYSGIFFGLEWCDGVTPVGSGPVEEQIVLTRVAQTAAEATK